MPSQVPQTPRVRSRKSRERSLGVPLTPRERSRIFRERPLGVLFLVHMSNPALIYYSVVTVL